MGIFRAEDLGCSSFCEHLFLSDKLDFFGGREVLGLDDLEDVEGLIVLFGEVGLFFQSDNLEYIFCSLLFSPSFDEVPEASSIFLTTLLLFLSVKKTKLIVFNEEMVLKV